MTPFQLRSAARILRDGGIVAYPTEAVWGLGCDPLNGDAVKRLLDLKSRAPSKGLILIGSSFTQIAPFTAPLNNEKMAEISASWPGPNTWIFPAAPDTPYWLTGGRDTIAVRVTAHPIASALCDVFGGAIVSTSANVSGKSAAKTALQVIRIPGKEVDMLLPGKLGDLQRPTPIRDALSGKTLRS